MDNYKSVAEIRQKAGMALASYYRSLDRIRADERLSDVGKREQIVDLWRATRDRVATLRDSEPALIARRIDEIERELFGGSTFTESAALSRRDANDRANAVADEAEGAAAYRQARQEGDTHLTRAIARKAFESGWATLVEEHSRVAGVRGRVDELVRLRAHQNDPGAQMMGAMHYSFGVPSEIAGLVS